MIEQIKLITETKSGTLIKVDATVEYKDGRIWFLKSPFSLKEEIKAMLGSKWHGFEDEPRKIWSVKDCPRNRFQLAYLKGDNPYAWFDREVIRHEYDRPLMAHQRDLVDVGLTYHYNVWAAGMGSGKSLSAIELIEKSNVRPWFWVGPRATMPAIRKEFNKWKLSVPVEMLTYEGLVKWVDEYTDGVQIPMGVIFDESSRLKNHTSQRSVAAQKLADLIRYKYDHDGYVIEMSGTPAPKTPLDWWSPAEIAYPGFLKEGSVKALEHRLAFMVDAIYSSGPVKKRVGWKDDANKCETCGQLRGDTIHDAEYFEDDYHEFVPSVNEVAKLYDRLKGLVVVKHKKDCLDLPDKIYRTVICKPNNSTLRVARAIAGSSANAVTAFVQLRELSDGFQYRETEAGMGTCPHCSGKKQVEEWYDPEDPEARYAAVDMLDDELVSKLTKHLVECPNCNGSGEVKIYQRTTREIPTPKEAALLDLLDENEEQGRIVIFAGFTGSVDRCTNICLRERWDVVRLDGRGYHVFRSESDGSVKDLHLSDDEALAYWSDMDNTRVAFVAQPDSGGMGLTLTEASMVVFWSNSYTAEYRSQAEDRIHRPGMDFNKGATIVDLIHLPTDARAIEVLRENRRLELLTMGEVMDVLKNENLEVAA
jgi:hypothetical protein